MNLYLNKTNKSKYMNNYDKYFHFLFNGKDIKSNKEKNIEEIGLSNNSYISAIEFMKNNE